MKTIFTFLSLLLCTTIYAQQPTFQWAKNIGGAQTDVGLDVATDATDNVYMCGRFMGTMDIDPGSSTQFVTSAGDFDMCVVKLDSEGNFQWAKTIGGTGFDQFTSLAIDDAGNCVLTGEFVGTIQPDPNNNSTTITASANGDVLILKLDDAGNTVWYHHASCDDYIVPTDLAIDEDNNILVSGSFQGTAEFNTIDNVVALLGTTNSTVTSNGMNDAYVLKVLSDGSFSWVKTFGSTSFDSAASIGTDSQNRVNVAGRFRETADFDPAGSGQTSTSSGINDCFVLQLTSDGNYVWHHTFGGTDYDEIWSIDVDPSDNLITFGYFSGTVDLDPNTGIQNATSLGSDDLFIQKFNSSGSLTWVKTFGGSELEDPYDLITDSDGNVILTGDFFNTVDFDPGPGVNNITSAGNNDIFFMQLSPEGEFDWAFRIGATFSQAGYAITTDASDHIIGTGTFSNLVDFDPGSSTSSMSAQDFNIYVVKFGDACILPELSAVTANDPTVCVGETATITIDGTLNGATTWQLMSNDCAGNLIGTTNTSTIEFIPETNTTYFIRGNGGCVTAGQEVCLPIDITASATSETSEYISVCEGESYTFPDGVTENITESVQHISTFTNVNGCDSIVYTNVNVPFLPNDITIQFVGNNLEALNVPGKSPIEIQWVDCNNNLPIDGQTGTVFENPEAGSYALMYSYDGCSEMTDCILIIGIEEMTTSSFSVFPNPSNDSFMISSSHDQLLDLEIFATDGKLIWAKNQHPVSQPIEWASNIPCGIYFLKARGNHSSGYIRLVKN